MTDRRIIVVDTETDGLDLMWNRPVEVGWLAWRGFGSGVFVPPHRLGEHSDRTALQINAYQERIERRERDDDYDHTRLLHMRLTGAVLAGANVRFDAAMLSWLFRDAGLPPEPWHHRLLDVEAYAAGRLNIPPWRLPGLRELVQLTGVPYEPTHGAWADVRAAAAVLDAVTPPGEVPCSE